MADFILLATADWDHPLWTNKQHVAMALVELGHRVLYVESLGLRGARSDRADVHRILKRLGRALLPPRRIRPGLWVWSPLVLPGGTKGLALQLNRLSLRSGLAASTFLTRLRKPLLWSFNPLVHNYLPLEGYQAAIYHCVDRVQAQPGMPATRLDGAERELCQRVDVVFTTAPQLQEALAPLNAATYCFGNVADADHFAQARGGLLACPREMGKIPAPRVMFIGAIDAYKLDLQMLEKLARATPQWRYVLIGPVGETDPGTDVSRLQSLANVHFLGPRPYAALPHYLAHADVALLPLRLNEYTRNMYPMKFFEYLAAGCPVVATAIPSLLDQGDVALLREPDAEAFRQAIASALAGRGPSLEQRLERAGLHTYRLRTLAMLDLLERRGLLPLDSEDHAPPRLPVSHYLLKRIFIHTSLLLIRGLERLQRLWTSSKSEQMPWFATLTKLSGLTQQVSDYCKVVLTNQAIYSRNAGAIRTSLPPLEEVIKKLECDHGTFCCLQPNRDNRTEFLISAQLALLRALLTLRDWQALDVSGLKLMESLQRYRPEAIDPHSAPRLTRNTLSCLAIEAIAAWRARDAARFGECLDQVHRIRAISDLPELDLHFAASPEDHRGFAAEMVRQLEPCRWPANRPDLRPDSEKLLGALILITHPRLDWSRAAIARRVLEEPTAA